MGELGLSELENIFKICRAVFLFVCLGFDYHQSQPLIITYKATQPTQREAPSKSYSKQPLIITYKAPQPTKRATPSKTDSKETLFITYQETPPTQTKKP
jgi:hypothetical protein